MTLQYIGSKTVNLTPGQSYASYGNSARQTKSVSTEAVDVFAARPDRKP